MSREREQKQGKGDMMSEKGMSRRGFLKAGGAGLVGATLLGAAGCGSQKSGGDTADQAALVKPSDVRIEFVTHGPASDPFWSVVKNGMDQAANDLGVDAKYRAPDSFDIPQIQQNFDSAIASDPNGIAASIVDPDAIGSKVKDAVNKGIPVVALNAGLDVWKKLGALNYVGQTEFEAGVEAGKRMAEAGVKNAICLNHQQGTTTLDQRCNGFDKGLGGTVKQVAVDGSDPTAARNGVRGALRQNSSIDGILALGPQGAIPALKELEGSGELSSIKFATFDLAPEVLQAVKDGKMLFAIDQQQFLQGYLPVLFLAQYIEYLMHPVGVIPTGPNLVTKDTAQEVINLTKAGIR